MGLAAALASGSLGRGYYGDHIPPTPDPPGRGPADRQDSPSGVQQRELLGAGSSDGRSGERINQPKHHQINEIKRGGMWRTDEGQKHLLP